MKTVQEQNTVIMAPVDAAMKVMAGAGTGKTRVLVERYLRFVREEQIPPSRILALTFTLKAADEMRQRVYSLMEKADPAGVRDLDGAWIMNFHSFGYRLIRENAPAFGIEPGIDVATSADILSVEKVLRARFIAGHIAGVPEDFGGDMPSPTRFGGLFAKMMKVVKKCRDELMEPDKLRSAVRDDDAPGYSAFVDSIAALYVAYEAELRSRNLIDFNDMIAVATRGLLSHQAIRQKYAGQFDHILVDEFQDTSTAQYQLIEALTHGTLANVTVVGDEKQSIYRWRDAHVENLSEFPGKAEYLTVNFRSTQAILDLAHAVVCKDAYFGTKADEIRLSAYRKNKDVPVVLYHPPGHRDGEKQVDAEAAALAAWVKHLTEGTAIPQLPALVSAFPVARDQVAVLLRTLKRSSGLPVIEEAFRRVGIPFAVVGGANSAESNALEGLHAFLSLLLPGNCEQALLLVLEAPPFLLDDVTLAELFAKSESTPRGNYGELLSAEWLGTLTNAEFAARCAGLCALLNKLRASWVNDDFRSFLAKALVDGPFYYQLFSEGVTKRAVDDLTGELFIIADQLEARDRLNLPAFLERLRTVIDERSFGVDKDLNLPPGRVRIMTIHQAKGLEFTAVAVPGVKRPRSDTDGFFLSKNSGVYTKEKESWNRSYDQLPEWAAEKTMKEREERCLLYVAMTRAKDFLFVSTPYPDGRETKNKSSMFVDALSYAAGEPGERVVVWREVDVGGLGVGPSSGLSDREEKNTCERLLNWQRNIEHSRNALQPGSDRSAVRYVTWLALLAYANCPLQYRYRHLLRLGDIPEDDGLGATDVSGVWGGDRMTDAQYGHFVHEVLREIVEARAEGRSAASSCMHTVAERVGYDLKFIERAKGSVELFLESDVAVPYPDLRTEEPFYVRKNRIILHGIADRIERVGDDLLVTDYKTGKQRESHQFQVQFYSWAIKAISGGNVTGQLCYLRKDGILVEPVSTDNARIEKLVEALENSLSTGEFPGRPGTVCRICAHRSFCPSFASD